MCIRDRLDILEKELKESKAEVEAFGTKVEAIAADLTVEGLVMDTVCLLYTSRCV